MELGDSFAFLGAQDIFMESCAMEDKDWSVCGCEKLKCLWLCVWGTHVRKGS